MGKKNHYSFSKRQRELKKKKKAEEKRARKLAKKEGIEAIDPDTGQPRSEEDIRRIMEGEPDYGYERDDEDEGDDGDEA
jgi:hypothetical protein